MAATNDPDRVPDRPGDPRCPDPGPGRRLGVDVGTDEGTYVGWLVGTFEGSDVGGTVGTYALMAISLPKSRKPTGICLS